MIGDGHQPNSRGLYPHSKDSLGGMTIPNIRTLDAGTYGIFVDIHHVSSKFMLRRGSHQIRVAPDLWSIMTAFALYLVGLWKTGKVRCFLGVTCLRK